MSGTAVPEVRSSACYSVAELAALRPPPGAITRPLFRVERDTAALGAALVAAAAAGELPPVRWGDAAEADRRRSLIAALQGGHLGTVYALQPEAEGFRAEVNAVDLTVAEALEVLATQPPPDVCRFLVEKADADAAAAYLGALRFPLGFAAMDAAPAEARSAYVRAALADKNDEHVIEALRILAADADLADSCADAVLAALRHRKAPAVIEAAGLAAANLGDGLLPRVAAWDPEVLEWRLQDWAERQPARALIALAVRGAPVALANVLAEFLDGDAASARSALDAVGPAVAQDGGVAARVIHLIGDDDAHVREAAVLAVRRGQLDRSCIVTCLDDPSEDVRAAAAAALCD